MENSALGIAQQIIGGAGTDAPTGDVVPREQQEVAETRKNLVTRWVNSIKNAKEFHKAATKRIEEDMKFAKGEQWLGMPKDHDKYTANLVQRHIQQRVSSLYAKNPKAICKMKTRLEYKIWDGDINSIQQALVSIQQALEGGMPPPPEAVALMEEISAVKNKKSMYEKIGKTAEILYQYYMSEGEPNFKLQAKQMIRRVEVCGVAYVKLGFHRAMEKSPDTAAGISDVSNQLDTIEQLSADIADGEIEQHQAEVEELQQTLKTLQSEPDMVVEEGLIFDFPKTRAIIFDPACVQIKGWVGADWIAQEFMFTKDEIQKIYNVDIGTTAVSYNYPYLSDPARGAGGLSSEMKSSAKKTRHAVWEIQSKSTGMVLTVCDGYNDYLAEPAAPKIKIKRFYTIFSLSFNDIEDDEDVYPLSDVRLMRSMQIEYNRSREGLREHRIANRPAYGGVKGVLEDTDKGKLANHSTNEFIEFNVPLGTNMETVIQPLKKVPIDPAVYDTAPLFDDVSKVVGSQTADFGGTSSSSATEVSIAEGSRMSTITSNVDDLDDLLTELARSAGEVMLREVSPQTAMKIAGEGAVWPELSGQEVADELILEIQAGSSGRPNKAQEIANFERLAPTLLQISGISPTWLAKQAIMRMDDTIDLEDAIIDGLPSMISMNAAQRPSTGDPASDPNQQGGKGGNKTSKPSAHDGRPASHPTQAQVTTGNAGG